jgi:hypothetical protein
MLGGDLDTSSIATKERAISKLGTLSDKLDNEEF